MSPRPTTKTSTPLSSRPTRLLRLLISLPSKFPWKMNSPHFLRRVMSLGDASQILYDQEDDPDSSTDVDSSNGSDEVTLISHEPSPNLTKFEHHTLRQKASYPAPTQKRPPLVKTKPQQPIYAQRIRPTTSSHSTPSTHKPHPPNSTSGSPWLPSAYPRSPTEPHYHILPDTLSDQGTALSPPPWHRSQRVGKVLCEPVDDTVCPTHHSTKPCWSCDRGDEGSRFPF